MSVIRFPHAVQNRKNQLALKMEPVDSIHDRIQLGPWTFTCTRCDTKTEFNTSGMIFKQIEFYCGSCGNLHRVTNPAFSSKK